ncbi:MAG: excinuclease ABC subunit UvrC, partial [Chloroflexota bacterium]
TGEDWPRVYVTRRLEEDGARYFGPFASARSVRQTLKIIKGLFPFRSCTRPITGTDARACLEYYLHNCAGPCIGEVDRAEYAGIIKQVILFLEGRRDSVLKGLEREMQQASDTMQFEKAARLRDQIQGVKQVIEGQQIAATVSGEQDAIAFARDRDQSYVQVFFIRRGKIIGRESFVLEGTRFEEPPQVMASFIKQFYQATQDIPPGLLLQYPVDDAATIEDWLKAKAGHKVRLQVPRRGPKKQLIDIVAENAEQGLEQAKIRRLPTAAALTAALAEVARELGLPRPPARIEGYDISDVQGTAAVGSMVVMEKGKARPDQYRRFRIRTVSGANDYAMLQEVLRRRFKRGNLGGERTAWTVLPDLVLIDGGRGQINAALATMREAGVESIAVVGLAKENEELFIPGQARPIRLARSSAALQLLQRLRDEAHRFALGYHHQVRRREAFGSALDAVPGIGPKRKRALLRQFGSVPAIRQATVEELVTAGITASLARKIKELL